MPNLDNKTGEIFKKEPKTSVKTEKKAFYYRCIKIKEPVGFKGQHITSDMDFKLGEFNQVKIVETGKTDWHEFVNSDANKNAVGLNNILKQAVASGLKPENRPFDSTGEEGMDFTHVPATVSELKDSIQQLSGSEARLKETASKLGLSPEDLVKKLNSGTLNEYIEGFVRNLKDGTGGDNNEK